MLSPRSTRQRLAAAATQLRWIGGKRCPQRVHAVVLEALATASAVSWIPRSPAFARITPPSGPSGRAPLHHPRHRRRSLCLDAPRRSPRREEEKEQNESQGMMSATPPRRWMSSIWTGTIAPGFLVLGRPRAASLPIARLKLRECAKVTLADRLRLTNRDSRGGAKTERSGGTPPRPMMEHITSLSSLLGQVSVRQLCHRRWTLLLSPAPRDDRSEVERRRITCQAVSLEVPPPRPTAFAGIGTSAMVTIFLGCCHMISIRASMLRMNVGRKS